MQGHAVSETSCSDAGLHNQLTPAMGAGRAKRLCEHKMGYSVALVCKPPLHKTRNFLA